MGKSTHEWGEVYFGQTNENPGNHGCPFSEKNDRMKKKTKRKDKDTKREAPNLEERGISPCK